MIKESTCERAVPVMFTLEMIFLEEAATRHEMTIRVGKEGHC